MASKTFYPLSTKFSGVEHLEMQDGGVAPATATTSTGWTVGTVSSGNYSRMDSATERASATFSGTLQPSSAPNNTLGDCFVAGPYTGQFAGGTWTFSFPVIAVTSGGVTNGRMRLRMWRSVNASGASATEISSGVPKSQVLYDIATGAAQTCVITISPLIVTMTGEYLLVQLAWEITEKGGTTTDDVLLRVGAATNIATPNFSSGVTLATNIAMNLTLVPTLRNVPSFGANIGMNLSVAPNVNLATPAKGMLSSVPASKVMASNAGGGSFLSQVVGDEDGMVSSG